MPQASIAPIADAPAALTYTPAQQAWLNFVDKVRRGEQVDPTGQYVKDGTIVPADQEQRTRPKLDAARDKYPFVLRADGTVVLLAKAGAKGQSGSSFTDPNDNPPMECPPGESCPPSGYPPAVTTTFVTSLGLGGSGDILDMKLPENNFYSQPGYYVLDSDLNKGAGGVRIYYFFTRIASQILRGDEYDADPTLSTTDPIVAYDSKTTHWFYQSVPQPKVDFYHIWNPGYVGNPNSIWKKVDLNDGAGGEYIYSYQAKKLRVGNGAAPFHEIGILSGNSGQIQPPAGWVKWPQDLNDSAGGDYIYFCYKQ